VNRLRFSHDVDADETTVTLVAPLDQAGAALLLDEPQQPANLDVSDHSSIAEAMLDVIETLKFKNPPDPSATLAAGWAGADPHAFLDPTQWTATALVAAPGSDNGVLLATGDWGALRGPSGVVPARPIEPAIASRSSVGVVAASKGVRPSSSSSGRSASPSGITIAYFTRTG